MLFGENRMLENKNRNRKAEAVVQVKKEPSCTREAIVEMERRGTFKVYLRWH